MRACTPALVLALCACGGDDDPAAGDAGASADASDELPRWDALGDLPSGAVQETAVVALGGAIYVIGGIDAAIATVDQVLIYRPDDDEWSEGPPLPTAVHHANATVVGDTIYVAGALAPSFAPLGVVWSWTPGDDAWSTDHQTMPAGSERGASMVGVVDGRVLVAGGSADTSSALVSAYDPQADEWDDTLAALPEPIDYGTGQAVDGVFYAIGGRSNGITATRDAVYAYDPGNDEWLPRAAMPTARGGVGSGVVDGAIIVVGGEGNGDAPSGVFPQAELYDPDADEWTSLPDMRTPRHGMGAAGLDGALYVPGGADQMAFGAVATHEVLRLR